MSSVGIGTQPWANKCHPPLSPFPHREAWPRAGACLRQPQVGHGHGHQITTLGPGIVLSTFSCPCSRGVAWHGLHYASSAWLMGHSGMTQPPQANSMPPVMDRWMLALDRKLRHFHQTQRLPNVQCRLWFLVSRPLGAVLKGGGREEKGSTWESSEAAL